MLLSKDLEKCKGVVVNGRGQVKEVAEGLEAILWSWFYMNHSNDKATLYLFGEDDRLIFTSVRKKYNIPEKQVPDEDLKFNDLFQPA